MTYRKPLSDFKIMVLLISMFVILSWGIPTACSKLFTTANGFYGESK